MKVRVAGVWKSPLDMFAKVSGTWMKIVNGWVNVAGTWRKFYTAIYRFSQVSDIIADTTNWVYDSTRGWYKNTYSWNATNNSKFDSTFLSRIRKVRATFTCYNNNPSGGIGQVLIRLDLSNATNVLIGVSDGNTIASSGQARYDQGSYTIITSDVVDQILSYTVPDGVTVTALYLCSNGYNNGATYYPFSLRGMKDFEFELS